MAQYQASSAGQAAADRGELPSPLAAPAGQRGPSSDFEQRERDAGLYLGGNDPMAGRRAPQPTLPQDQQAQGPAPDPLNLPSPAGTTAPQDDSVVPDNQPPVPAPTATTYAPGNQKAKPAGKDAMPEVPRSMVEASFDLPAGKDGSPRQGVIRQGDNVGDTFRRYRGDAPELPSPGEDGMSRHKVHSGETIAEIAQKYDMTSSELIEANSLPADAVAADLDGRELVVGGSPKPSQSADKPKAKGTKEEAPAPAPSLPPEEVAAQEEYEPLPPVDEARDEPLSAEAKPSVPKSREQSPNDDMATKRARAFKEELKEAGIEKDYSDFVEFFQNEVPVGIQRLMPRAVNASSVADVQAAALGTVETIRGRIDDLRRQDLSIQRDIQSGMSIRPQSDGARLRQIERQRAEQEKLLRQAEKFLKKF